MSLPKTHNAYGDCYDLWDRALEKPYGIRFRVKDNAAAINLRMRLHMARSIQQDDNAKLYEPGTPMHGQSIYDPLQVLIREDTDLCWWVYIEPRAVPIIGEIEELQPYNQDDPQWLTPPKSISTTGVKLLEKKSESESNALTEPSSLQPSTPPERTPMIPGLRRL